MVKALMLTFSLGLDTQDLSDFDPNFKVVVASE